MPGRSCRLRSRSASPMAGICCRGSTCRAMKLLWVACSSSSSRSTSTTTASSRMGCQVRDQSRRTSVPASKRSVSRRVWYPM